jgi:signal transduction histidine kinase
MIKPRSTFARYWFALAAIASLPTIMSGFMDGWFVYRDSFSAAVDRQTLQARAAAHLIERNVLQPVDRVRFVAGIPWDYETATASEQLAEMRRVIRLFPLVERIQRVAPTGAVIAFHSQNGSARRIDPAERDRLAHADRGQRSAVLVRRTVPGDWSIAFAERGTGNWLVADLRTDVVNDLVRATPSTRTGLVFVVDPDRNILAHPDLSFVYAREKLTDLRGWNAVGALEEVFSAAAPQEGSLGEIRAQGSADPSFVDRWFVAYRRIPELGWTVFALAPSAGFRAQVRAVAMRTAGIALAANGLALLVALALARRLSRPLAELATVSQRVADGDLTAQARVRGDDDVGRLCRQFNAMVDELRESYGQLERRVAEKTADLEQANRHKSEFLAQMSHELRTPLTSILGFSDVLKAQMFGPLNEKQTEYLHNIHASGQHLLVLINDLLDLAKVEAGRMTLAVEPFDVRSLAESAQAMVRERARTKGVSLGIHIDPTVTSAVADGLRVKQVLVNLLSNAVKFTAAGGSVDVSVRRIEATHPGGADTIEQSIQTRPALLFKVIDTGIGIAPEDIARLFTDYGQVSKGPSVVQEGTGLGLVLSRRLVELHGGEIGVRSEPGRGSTFYFALPERPWPVN